MHSFNAGEGESVGINVGITVGNMEGVEVVGLTVGDVDGLEDGICVGECVG